MTKLIIFINIVFVFGQFILSSLRAGDGAHLDRVQTQLQTIHLANADLSLKIYAQSSLSRILMLATDRHFVPAHLSAWSPPAVALESHP